MRRFLAIVLVSSVAMMAPLPASGQLPSEPIRMLDGRLVLSGEAAVAVASSDNESYFNYTDYERNALRTVRLSLVGLWQPADRLAFVGELRSEDFDSAGAYAAYVRVRPWTGLRFDIQAGRIPPVFGAFGRRTYSGDRSLIGYPLAYQYLTSLRTDAVPAIPDDLLIMRARGWRSAYPVGSSQPGPGVPLVSAFRWDTGVQARWSTDRADAAVSLTTGTLSHPRISDDNDSKQIAARVGVRPAPGLALGLSAARGGWVSREIPSKESSGRLTQSAIGADVEYSRDHWIIRGEMIRSRWRVPFLSAPPQGPVLDAMGSWIEGRYRISPRWYAAARADRLGFSKITGTILGGVAVSWEAPVTRYEAGGGYYLQRNLVARATVQWNHRDAGRVRSRTFLSGQVAYWF